MLIFVGTRVGVGVRDAVGGAVCVGEGVEVTVGVLVRVRVKVAVDVFVGEDVSVGGLGVAVITNARIVGETLDAMPRVGDWVGFAIHEISSGAQFKNKIHRSNFIVFSLHSKNKSWKRIFASLSFFIEIYLDSLKLAHHSVLDKFVRVLNLN